MNGGWMDRYKEWMEGQMYKKTDIKAVGHISYC
jgi:hypothetical protein